MYDYFVNPKTQKFQPWAELVTDIDYDGTQPMSTVFVPTAETSSLRFFLDMMVELRKPIMFVGGAGVGKTQLVKGKLSSLSEDFISLSISFNYFTDVVSFQKVGLVRVVGGRCGAHGPHNQPCKHQFVLHDPKHPARIAHCRVQS